MIPDTIPIFELDPDHIFSSNHYLNVISKYLEIICRENAFTNQCIDVHQSNFKSKSLLENLQLEHQFHLEYSNAIDCLTKKIQDDTIIARISKYNKHSLNMTYGVYNTSPQMGFSTVSTISLTTDKKLIIHTIKGYSQ